MTLEALSNLNESIIFYFFFLIRSLLTRSELKLHYSALISVTDLPLRSKILFMIKSLKNTLSVNNMEPRINSY